MSDASTPKTWLEAWSSHIVWGGLVFTCFLVFIEKLIEQHFGQALASFLLGLGIAAVALHSKTWLERTNPNWAYAAAIVAVLALIASPFLEQKRWPFSAWFPLTTQTPGPTADQIATAVVKALAKQEVPLLSTPDDIEKATAPIREQLGREQANFAEAQKERNRLREQLAAMPKPPSYINPLHTEATKWNAAYYLRHAVINGGFNKECRITIVQTPISYAEDYASDLKDILKVADLKFESRIATSPVDKGISVRAVNDDTSSRACADTFATMLRVATRNKDGNSLQDDPHRWLAPQEAPNHLKNCPSGCIEVGFGIDDGR